MDLPHLLSLFIVILSSFAFSHATDVRLNLSPTTSETRLSPCPTDPTVFTVENTNSLDPQQASNKLLYFVGLFSSGLDDQMRKQVAPFSCFNPNNLRDNFLTLHNDENTDSSTVYFGGPIQANLGSENSSVIVTLPVIGEKHYGSGSRTSLKTGYGKIILQKFCEFNDTNKIDFTILSTQNTFPVNNQPFMTALKKELEMSHQLTFSVVNCASGVEQKSVTGNDGHYSNRAERWVFGLVAVLLTWNSFY